MKDRYLEGFVELRVDVNDQQFYRPIIEERHTKGCCQPTFETFWRGDEYEDADEAYIALAAECKRHQMVSDERGEWSRPV